MPYSDPGAGTGLPRLTGSTTNYRLNTARIVIAGQCGGVLSYMLPGSLGGLLLMLMRA